MNYKSFAPGTHILFKRGDIWREMLQPTSGTSSGHITYGAYGTGAKPQLMGSIERNSTSDWVYEGGYWVSKGISKDVGNIIFNNDQSVGRKYWNLSELKSQGDFWYDATNRQVRMISSANPASLYSDIELALDGINIDMYQRNYVIIKDLWLRNGDYGIFIQNGSNIVIRNNDFSFLGGGKLGSGVRAGNGVEVWESGTNILIERNRLWEIYDAALSHQGANSTTQRNIVYRFNTVWRSEYCFEFFTYNTAAIVDGIEFSNNTCVDSGMGWGHAQRPDPSGRHVLFWDYRPTGRTVIKNNIFSRSAEVSLYIGTLNGNLGISNNLWQQAATSPIARGGTTTYTTQNFQTFKNNTGYALTDFIADPFFVNPAARDYAPALNSRACTASDTGSFIGAVPCK